MSAALGNGGVGVFRKYGRFLDAFLREMGDPEMDEKARGLLEESDRQIAEEARRFPVGNESWLAFDVDVLIGGFSEGLQVIVEGARVAENEARDEAE